MFAIQRVENDKNYTESGLNSRNNVVSNLNTKFEQKHTEIYKKKPNRFCSQNSLESVLRYDPYLWTSKRLVRTVHPDPDPHPPHHPVGRRGVAVIVAVA